MFTPPQIYSNEDINSRTFIYFYYNSKRYKFYNGNRLNLPIFPNHSKSLKERIALLKQLQYEFHKALSNGWSPNDIEKKKVIISTKEAFNEILTEKLNSPYSKFYKRDLMKLCEQFLGFLSQTTQNDDVNSIPQSIIELFLNQFKSSGRHYMNKRRLLAIFFSELTRKEYIDRNPIVKTSKQKIKAKLHEIYSEKQLREVLDYLKANHYNLYLCALITYGCLLRPHQEVRHLRRKHISTDFSEIHLSGDENKSGKVRTVYIPIYLQEELRVQLHNIKDLDTNIFTLDKKQSFNDDYFKTQWSRAKTQMLKQKLILKNQTLYSFRHTAVVNVYRKTKDLQIIQQLLQHSNMIVTLNYLRGLGEINNEDLKGVLPELNLM